MKAWRARRAGFGFAQTVFFSSIPCFLFVFRCSVDHSVENAPLLSIRAFDTAENEFRQVCLPFFFENAVNLSFAFGFRFVPGMVFE